MSESTVSIAGWVRYIQVYSRRLLARPDDEDLYDVDDAGHVIRAELTPAQAAGWLGHPPASADDIAAAEERLGTRLPQSYRSFLRTANGLIGPGTPWPYALLPASQVNWLREDEGMADMLDYVFGADVYGDEAAAMFHRALWITPPGDGDYWLLDPGDTHDGEWLAYSFPQSSGGEPDPAPGFAALMDRELSSMVEVFSSQDG